jgi:hypothetical protein
MDRKTTVQNVSATCSFLFRVPLAATTLSRVRPMTRSSTTLGFVSGLGAGAALMYFLDPDRGARRRALIRDKVTHWNHQLNDASRATTRDLGHRLEGAAARLRRYREDQSAPDEILVERVRARLGRVVMHPRAIDVVACDGVVTLCGPLSTQESEAAVAAAASTPGVVEVVNRLDPDGAAHEVPAPRPRIRRSGAIAEA